MRYIIPRIPPSNNRYIGRSNRWEYQNDKKFWAKLVYTFCTPKPKEPLEKCIVRITYYFPDRRRRDPDNYSGKMILDGLVLAGILKDDCFGKIDLVLLGLVDRRRPRTEIEIIGKR